MGVVEERGLRDRSTAELIKDLTRDTRTLVRQEVELAKVEMVEKSKKAGIGIGLLAGAAVGALLALGALTAFLILALDGAMPNWAAAILVALLWIVVAAGLAYSGREALRELGGPVPDKTVETIKEDIEWLKNPTS